MGVAGGTCTCPAEAGTACACPDVPLATLLPLISFLTLKQLTANDQRSTSDATTRRAGRPRPPNHRGQPPPAVAGKRRWDGSTVRDVKREPQPDTSDMPDAEGDTSTAGSAVVLPVPVAALVVQDDLGGDADEEDVETERTTTPGPDTDCPSGESSLLRQHSDDEWDSSATQSLLMHPSVMRLKVSLATTRLPADPLSLPASLALIPSRSLIQSCSGVLIVAAESESVCLRVAATDAATAAVHSLWRGAHRESTHGKVVEEVSADAEEGAIGDGDLSPVDDADSSQTSCVCLAKVGSTPLRPLIRALTFILLDATVDEEEQVREHGVSALGSLLAQGDGQKGQCGAPASKCRVRSPFVSLLLEPDTLSALATCLRDKSLSVRRMTRALFADCLPLPPGPPLTLIVRSFISASSARPDEHPLLLQCAARLSERCPEARWVASASRVRGRVPSFESPADQLAAFFRETWWSDDYRASVRAMYPDLLLPTPKEEDDAGDADGTGGDGLLRLQLKQLPTPQPTAADITAHIGPALTSATDRLALRATAAALNLAHSSQLPEHLTMAELSRTLEDPAAQVALSHSPVPPIAAVLLEYAQAIREVLRWLTLPGLLHPPAWPPPLSLPHYLTPTTPPVTVAWHNPVARSTDITADLTLPLSLTPSLSVDVLDLEEEPTFVQAKAAHAVVRQRLLPGTASLSFSPTLLLPPPPPSTSLSLSVSMSVVRPHPLDNQRYLDLGESRRYVVTHRHISH